MWVRQIMDMIGRLNKETGVSIIGYGISPTFETIFNKIDSTNYVKFYVGYEGRVEEMPFRSTDKE